MSQVRRTAVSTDNLGLLAIAIVAVSSSGPLMAGATQVPALAMSSWRTTLGGLVFAIPVLIGRRAELRAMTRHNWFGCLVAGVMLAGHFATWTSSLKMTSVASATALVCLQVAWVVVIAWLMHQPVKGKVWVGLAIALTGVLVISGVDWSISQRALVGDFLAVMGGIFSAVYVVVGGKVREQMSTTTYAFVCYTSCGLLLFAVSIPSGVQLTGFDTKSWLIIISVTITAQIVGHSLINHLLAVMSPTFLSLALLLEVPGAALLAAVFLGQAPPIAVYAGLALILAGLAVVVRAGAVERRLEAALD